MTLTQPVVARSDAKANILIVDDLQEKHVVFRSILESLGENIVSARSGREALAQVLNNEFAVILLDVNMPDIDGLETASLIRQYKRSAQTPIVFITAYVDELQAKRGYALGAVDYIPSPVMPDVLRSKVKVFVELFRMNRQLQLRAAEREALARAEAARAAAEQAIARADFLAEASQRLSRSLDPEQTAQALIEVAVPMLGRSAMLVSLNGDDGVKCLCASTPHECALPPLLAQRVRTALSERRLESWEDSRSGEEDADTDANASAPQTDLLADGAAMVFPLVTADGPRTALLLRGPNAMFDPPRVALAREVVSRASIAMENARLYAAVQQADRRKNEFLAMLAHELRNPLAPIRNAVHIMQGEQATPDTQNWARDVISRQTDHMARLIDDLLDVSRIVQGKVVVKPEKLMLAALIERSAESSAPRLAACEQRLRVNLPPQDIEVDGDSVRLAQVVSNLINNASKFSDPGADIELNASYHAGQLMVSVRDQGCGIEAEFLPHIFELFVQGDQTLDRAQGGLGIGLTLVKHLVELHGGRVEATSAGPGQGTEVRVYLPAALGAVKRAEGAPVAPETPQAPAAAATEQRRVLVVDDLAASAETLTMLLEMEGYDVRVASEGVSALNIAQEFEPDVVLLDIGLPGMNGFEIAKGLRAMPAGREALLIALTGYGEAESRNRSAEAGFDYHMVKPADVTLLLSMVADPQQVRDARDARTT
ncbi:MAG TPA: response regulator [Ramlibacter sp.]|nr:response regulator [Ramlibacter sp.]